MHNPIASKRFLPVVGIGLKVAASLSLAAFCASAGADPMAVAGSPAIDFHVISAGGRTQTNSCFRVSGTVGQVAPGYSSNAQNAILAGFWAAAAQVDADTIFFNGFEGC